MTGTSDVRRRQASMSWCEREGEQAKLSLLVERLAPPRQLMLFRRKQRVQCWYCSTRLHLLPPAPTRRALDKGKGRAVDPSPPEGDGPVAVGTRDEFWCGECGQITKRDQVRPLAGRLERRRTPDLLILPVRRTARSCRTTPPSLTRASTTTRSQSAVRPSSSLPLTSGTDSPALQPLQVGTASPPRSRPPRPPPSAASASPTSPSSCTSSPRTRPTPSPTRTTPTRTCRASRPSTRTASRSTRATRSCAPHARPPSRARSASGTTVSRRRRSGGG